MFKLFNLRRDMKPIFLVGFMGTGKSAVSKQLSKRLSLDLVDLDDKIEENTEMKIVDIFANHGEEYFRDCERQALLDSCELNNSVVSCGGGIVLNPANVEAMEAHGIAVCLDASAEVIYNRVKHSSHRPLLNVDDPLAKIRELLNKRNASYERISFHIATDELSLEEVCDKIIEHLELQV